MTMASDALEGGDAAMTGLTDAGQRPGAGSRVDAVVIGAGHNGLIAAAYLVRAGWSTVVLEARDLLGGTAGDEEFAGATVNLCNCDHLTFRTTPVMDELDLGAHGLTYLNVDPAQLNRTWDDESVWAVFHDVERTLDSLGRLRPQAITGYHRYLDDAIPAARFVLSVASSGPPTPGRVLAHAARDGGRAATRVMRWSRSSAAEVLGRYVDDEAILAPALAVGPVVWGLSPRLKGTGLGALTLALRHVATVGRPVGGSGSVARAIASMIRSRGGQIETGTRVSRIECRDGSATAVVAQDGRRWDTSVVISACDPRATLVDWVDGAPPAARAMIDRWRHRAHVPGYESKLDVVLDAPIRYRHLGDVEADITEVDPSGPTMVVSPSLDEIDRGFALLGRGEVMKRPVFLANVPTALDPTLAPPGRHVLSLEALFTPYGLPGGWPSSTEPDRWFDAYADLVEGSLRDRVVAMRAITPDLYESEFSLPQGHAASFAGGPLAALIGRERELTSYRSALGGLYLTGAATFPGAGVWGASGRNVAMAVLADARRRRGGIRHRR